MRIAFFFLILVYSISAAPQAVYAQTIEKAAPRVVVDIAPLHELVSELLMGITLPDLLVDGAQSPHFYQLKPSQAEQLARADAVILIGGGLIPPLDTLTQNHAGLVIRLSDMDLDFLAPSRSQSGHGHDGAIDPHVWLDPLLMRDAITQLANELGARWPEHAATLMGNRDTLVFRLNTLDARLRDTFGITPPPAPEGEIPYLFFHDAYRYFTKRYGLEDYGSLFVNPPELVGMREQLDATDRYATSRIHCLISESESPLVSRIAEKSGAKIILMQPTTLGMDSAAFRYDTALLHLANTLTACE